jgi:hypothetical protein
VEEFHDYSIPDKIMAITELQDNAENTALYIDSSYTETMKLLSGYADSFDVPEIEWIRVAGLTPKYSIHTCQNTRITISPPFFAAVNMRLIALNHGFYR